MSEIWRKIENTYLLVSNTGKVYSTAKKRMLNGYANKDGYLIIGYSLNGKCKINGIHQLVAKAFPEICGVWFDGCAIDHINTDKTDNRADNLRVCTWKENNNNPITKQNMSKCKKGELNPNHKKVIQCTLDGEQIKTFECTRAVTRDLGYDFSNIAACCRGKYKTAYGYIWKYTP